MIRVNNFRGNKEDKISLKNKQGSFGLGEYYRSRTSYLDKNVSSGSARMNNAEKIIVHVMQKEFSTRVDSFGILSFQLHTVHLALLRRASSLCYKRNISDENSLNKLL